MAISTIGVTLFSAATVTPTVKLCAIKSFPDLGGAPNALETTDMDSLMQTFINGVKKSSQMEFKANYTETDYDAVLAKCATDTYFALAFGTLAANAGVFSFTGQMSVFVNGASVDAVSEMTIVISPTSTIVKS